MSGVCRSISINFLPSPTPTETWLAEAFENFPRGKNYADLNDNPEFKSKVFPGPENSQSASLCFISTAQRGFQRHMRESLQPATELSIHSEIHSTKEPGPSRVSVPFITVAYIRITFLQEITYQVSILSMQLARGYPRFLGVLCVRSM